MPPVLPFAVRDSRSIPEGTASLAIDVMANDLINTNATRELVSFTQPSSGTVTRNENGTPGNTSDDTLIFTPASVDFNGVVTFTYVIDDNGTKQDGSASDPSTGTVTVTVTEVNDAPTVAATRTVVTGEDATNFEVLGSLLLSGASAGPLEQNQVLTIQNPQVLSGGGMVSLQNGNLYYTAASNFVVMQLSIHGN